jgi:hypothetical protein
LLPARVPFGFLAPEGHEAEPNRGQRKDQQDESPQQYRQAGADPTGADLS